MPTREKHYCMVAKNGPIYLSDSDIKQLILPSNPLKRLPLAIGDTS